MELLLASLGRPPAPALPNVIYGMVCLVVGVSAIRWRVRIYKATVDGEKRWFGKGFGEFLERLQSPFWVGVAGTGIVLMGIAAICYAIWRFFS